MTTDMTKFKVWYSFILLKASSGITRTYVHMYKGILSSVTQSIVRKLWNCRKYIKESREVSIPLAQAHVYISSEYTIYLMMGEYEPPPYWHSSRRESSYKRPKNEVPFLFIWKAKCSSTAVVIGMYLNEYTDVLLLSCCIKAMYGVGSFLIL